MGYTHYVRHTKAFTNEEWDRVRDAFARLVEAGLERGIALSVDHGDTPLSSHQRSSRAWELDVRGRPALWINGAEPQACETLVIYRDGPGREEWQRDDMAGFDFVKTRGHPYDTVVTAILCWVETVFPGRLNAASDGDQQDWTSGLDLARHTFPDQDIHLPPGIMDPSRTAESPRLVQSCRRTHVLRNDGNAGSRGGAPRIATLAARQLRTPRPARTCSLSSTG